MEIFKFTIVFITLIISVCFVIFLIWVLIMVRELRDTPNQKIEALGNFFSKIPVERFFNLLSKKNVKKKYKD